MATDEGAVSEFVKLNRDDFVETLKLVALRVPTNLMAVIRPVVANCLLKRPRTRNIIPADVAESDRLILLSPDIKSLADAPPAVVNAVETYHLSVVEHSLRFDYDFFSFDDVMQKMLPVDGREGVSAFETIGHVAHFNLRDHLLPYKYAIAQVLLDKNNHIKTVVNKTSNITNQFRVFPMEILGGDDNLETEVKQEGCVFRLNFGEVYWNSRLQSEHTRIAKMLKTSDILCDMFAGIGPFAVPAGKYGVTVYANDLNPRSTHYLNINVKLNHVQKKVTVSTMDARAFVLHLINQKIPFTHVLMNLPASAPSFLDVFRGVFAAWQPPTMPMVHCYCFSNDADARGDAQRRCEGIIGAPFEKCSVHIVRTVAPKKEMLCVSFLLPQHIACDSSLQTLHSDEQAAKRLKAGCADSEGEAGDE
eukprot:TRINITY_DN5919_c0_g1_i1.p1 TRINITY_DN5919_c0_g1~~TRINITY_DN5919_c0_g1_i1.p1  ORF type:complete len:448 (-),score=86.66 TRINITY_DN5919_c0_g1_i1:1239-2495(-)